MHHYCNLNRVSTFPYFSIFSCSFNPIAHTSMVKTLQKIAFSECQKTGTLKKSLRKQSKVKFHMPPKEVIESLAESSAGDIRSAVNALQFACLKGNFVDTKDNMEFADSLLLFGACMLQWCMIAASNVCRLNPIDHHRDESNSQPSAKSDHITRLANLFTPQSIIMARREMRMHLQ